MVNGTTTHSASNTVSSLAWKHKSSVLNQTSEKYKSTIGVLGRVCTLEYPIIMPGYLLHPSIGYDVKYSAPMLGEYSQQYPSVGYYSSVTSIFSPEIGSSWV